MSTPIIRVHDAATGETIDRPMNADELAVLEASREANEAGEQAIIDRENGRKSARTKLKALGLTDDEIAALIP